MAAVGVSIQVRGRRRRGKVHGRVQEKCAGRTGGIWECMWLGSAAGVVVPLGVGLVVGCSGCVIVGCGWRWPSGGGRGAGLGMGFKAAGRQQCRGGRELYVSAPCHWRLDKGAAPARLLCGMSLVCGRPSLRGGTRSVAGKGVADPHLRCTSSSDMAVIISSAGQAAVRRHGNVCASCDRKA